MVHVCFPLAGFPLPCRVSHLDSSEQQQLSFLDEGNEDEDTADDEEDADTDVVDEEEEEEQEAQPLPIPRLGSKQPSMKRIGSSLAFYKGECNQPFQPPVDLKVHD